MSQDSEMPNDSSAKAKDVSIFDSTTDPQPATVQPPIKENSQSPTTELVGSDATAAAATFPEGSSVSTAGVSGGNGSIQNPPRLQRSAIPPPIDTETATRDADSSLRSKLLSNNSIASSDSLSSSLAVGVAERNAKSASADSMAIDTPKLDEQAKNANGGGGQTSAVEAQKECSYIGVSFSKNRLYRRTMEDAHYYKYGFENVEGQSFMAVFDGHAGRQAAQWCGEHFADLFSRLHRDHVEELSVPEVFNRAFLEADRQLAADLKTHSGCTAAVAFVEVKNDPEEPSNKKRTLYCANAGDARAVLSRAGTAVRLTYDHKGDDVHEMERISESGGYVFNGRVNGILAVTRALGDSSLKQFVIGNPYTTETVLDKEDDILILACDGLWDVCSDQEAIDLIRDEPDPGRASEILLEYALDNKSMDNITVMVFRLPALPS